MKQRININSEFEEILFPEEDEIFNRDARAVLLENEISFNLPVLEYNRVNPVFSPKVFIDAFIRVELKRISHSLKGAN